MFKKMRRPLNLSVYNNRKIMMYHYFMCKTLKT